jgi:hypothetical protein
LPGQSHSRRRDEGDELSYRPVVQPGVMTRQECHRAMESLLAMRPAWKDRRPGFFTLGANAYQDAATEPVSYADKIRRSNAMLAETFGWMYEKLTLSMSAMTGLEAVLPDQLGWPGFHIFDESGLTAAGGQIHVDLQYLQLADAVPELPPADLVLSLTLPVMLPAVGGGLNVWPVRAGSPAAASANRGLPGKGWHELPHELISYDIGSLYLHSGHHYHQIAGAVSSARSAQEQWRVTLQGHGYVVGQRLYLYW